VVVAGLGDADATQDCDRRALGGPKVELRTQNALRLAPRPTRGVLASSPAWAPDWVSTYIKRLRVFPALVPRLRRKEGTVCFSHDEPVNSAHNVDKSFVFSLCCLGGRRDLLSCVYEDDDVYVSSVFLVAGPGDSSAWSMSTEI
jgi:hypothetical protein